MSIAKIVVGVWFGLLAFTLTVGAIAFLFFTPRPNPPAADPPAEMSAAAAENPSTYEIQLDGEYPNGLGKDPGVPFAGECLVTTSDIASESKAVVGTTPKLVSLSGRSLTCSVQKQSGNALRLKANVKKDGVIVKEFSTEPGYGVASFSV
jgi:hypothetical protein